MNLGTLVRCYNKRRSFKKKKNSLIEKVILNNRIKVEHKFAQYKQYKRLNSRMDKSLDAFKSYVFLASLIMIDK
jgi:hypothetical protein